MPNISTLRDEALQQLRPETIHALHVRHEQAAIDWRAALDSLPRNMQTELWYWAHRTHVRCEELVVSGSEYVLGVAQ